MQIYEIGYLILPSIPEGQISDVVANLKSIIAKVGGQELDSEEPFKYELAYTMSKTVGQSRYVVKDAYLGWLKFEIDAAKIAEVKTGLERTNELLRFLLIKVPRKTTFTFAKARARLEESEKKEEPAASPVEEAVIN